MKKATSLGGLGMGVTALLVGAASGHPQRKSSRSPSGEAKVKFESSWKRENLRIVAFVQGKKSRHVLGAAEIRAGEAGS